MNNKSEIEKILEGEVSPNEAIYTVASLRKYLSENGEELSLDQYMNLRKSSLEKYKANISSAVKEGKLDRDKDGVREVEHLLTDFIRYQHARLYVEKYGDKKTNNIPSDSSADRKKGIFEKTRGYFSRLKNNIEYKTNWKKKDDELYNLERSLIRGDVQDREKELIAKVPTSGLSKFKVLTLEKLASRAENKKPMKKILSYYRARNIKENAKKSLKSIWNSAT